MVLAGRRLSDAAVQAPVAKSLRGAWPVRIKRFQMSFLRASKQLPRKQRPSAPSFVCCCRLQMPLGPHLYASDGFCFKAPGHAYWWQNVVYTAASMAFIAAVVASARSPAKSASAALPPEKGETFVPLSYRLIGDNNKTLVLICLSSSCIAYAFYRAKGNIIASNDVALKLES